jgi:hypothetical protein
MRLFIAAALLVAFAGCAPSSSQYADLVVRTEQGAETIVPASLDRTYLASERAFLFFEIRRTAYEVSQDSQNRRLSGRGGPRDAQVWVMLEKTPAGNAHIVVKALSAAANPDLEFAAELTEKIIEYVDKLAEDGISGGEA